MSDMRRRLVDLAYNALAEAHEAKGGDRSRSIAAALRESLALYKQGRDRYDFHHLSLGALCCLFPGAIGRFGRWQVFDSLVNYDPTGVFTKGRKHFVLDADGRYVLTEDGPDTDGSLYLVSDTPQGRVHPSDNLAVERRGQLVKECLLPFAKTPVLDAADAKDRELTARALLQVASHVRGARLADLTDA